MHFTPLTFNLAHSYTVTITSGIWTPKMVLSEKDLMAPRIAAFVGKVCEVSSYFT